jgi:uncharacterized BrkB/YihY/UPF0761 family membrane protein
LLISRRAYSRSALEIAGIRLGVVTAKAVTPQGRTLLIGFGAPLRSAAAAMEALFNTLNTVYDEDEERGFLKLTAVSLGFTIAGRGVGVGYGSSFANFSTSHLVPCRHTGCSHTMLQCKNRVVCRVDGY